MTCWHYGVPQLERNTFFSFPLDSSKNPHIVFPLTSVVPTFSEFALINLECSIYPLARFFRCLISILINTLPWRYFFQSATVWSLSRLCCFVTIKLRKVENIWYFSSYSSQHMQNILNFNYVRQSTYDNKIHVHLIIYIT